MQSVLVESVLWEGPYGGAIFNASTSTGSRYRIVAAAEVMPRPPVVGEVWAVNGVQKKHPQYGTQVHADRARLCKPSGRLIVQTLTGSRSFPGIGEKTAAKLWTTFGEDLYALLDAGDPEPFGNLLGPDLSRVLVQGWRQLSVEAETFRWLDVHGLPMNLARTLIRTYRNDVVATMERNPYCLVSFLPWKQADLVGRNLAIEATDPKRLVGATDAMVYRRLSESHTVTPYIEFVAGIRALLRCNQKTAEEATKLALEHQAIENVGEDGVQGVGAYAMERFIASKAMELVNGMSRPDQMSFRQPPTPDLLAEIYDIFKARAGMTLNPAQREAVRLAASEDLACIIGGAGVGKTTVLRAIHLAATRLGFSGVCQMALSGRAAKRMAEATGEKAYTIAGFLLGVDSGNIDLTGEPLIIVDEASMLDLSHCFRIMRRMPPGARLLLVGDPAQLPPIGFGLTFHALVHEAMIPSVELTDIHRQAAETGIPQVSVDVREGVVPDLVEYTGKGFGVSFIEAKDSMILERLLDVVHDFGGIQHCHVIGAVKRGAAGINAINQEFHALVAGGRPDLYGFAIGEPVIWTVNNYEMGLLNGSLGVVKDVCDDELLVEFDGVPHQISRVNVKDMRHAYGITVHKAQGSQAERVAIPVFRSKILDRTLLYTAITRAEKQVVLIGDREAFEQAITAEPAPSRRHTGMTHHLHHAKNHGTIEKGPLPR